jgi:hypothetical protein
MTRRNWILIGVAILAAVVGLLLWMRFGEFWAIDSCLDSGGVWDYAAGKCERS